MTKPLSKATIAARIAAPWASEDERAIALVILDAALLKDERLFQAGELRDDQDKLVRAARRLYLKSYPRCLDIKAGLRLFASHIDRWQELEQTPSGRARPATKREFVYQCLFCREDVATLGDDGVRQVANVFWCKLELHCLECACRLVLGELVPKAPRLWQRAKDDPKETPRERRRRRKRRMSSKARAAAKERARQRRIARWPGFSMQPTEETA